MEVGRREEEYRGENGGWEEIQKEEGRRYRRKRGGDTEGRGEEIEEGGGRR